MMPGVTLVISPLISLMKDQVDSLVNQEIPATYINSQCTFEEVKARFAAIRAGRIKLVYISPERLENQFFTAFMQTLPISMFIIDEATVSLSGGTTLGPATVPSATGLQPFPKGLSSGPLRRRRRKRSSSI